MIQLQLGFGGERKVIYHRGYLEEKGKLDFHCYSLLHRHFLLREIDLPFETYFQTLLFSFLNRMMFARRDTALDPRIVARVTESTFVVKSPLIQRTHTNPILQKLTRMGVLPGTFMGGYRNIPLLPPLPHLRPPQRFWTALFGRLPRHCSMGQYAWSLYSMANKSTRHVRVLCRHGWQKAV